MNIKESIKQIVLPFYNKSMPTKAFNEPVVLKIKIKNSLIKHILSLKPITQIIHIFPFIRKIFFQVSVNERIVEIPFVFRHLNLPQGSKVLDLGCVRSPIALYLSNLGYKVTGSDLRKYLFTHPNLVLLRGNFLNKDVPNASFDAVLAISTLEHVGLEKYGSSKFERGDEAVMRKLYQVLRKKGKLIITVPFGKKEASHWMKVYDYKSLTKLIKGFKIENEEFFYRKNEKDWTKVEPEFLKDISSVRDLRGVALISAVKIE